MGALKRWFAAHFHGKRAKLRDTAAGNEKTEKPFITEKPEEETKDSGKEAKEPVNEDPVPENEIEIANLQGIGDREEQQDAFGLSPLNQYAEKGILAVLCDGMGGMTGGSQISVYTVSRLLATYPWEKDEDILRFLQETTGEVYSQYMGRGGTTVVAVRLLGNELSFWSIGDSDLFLLRGEKLFLLNLRHEYKNTLMIRALESGFPPEEAFMDEQAGALTEYVGKETAACDYTKKPFLLEAGDTLLLSSDGISDTLTLEQIRKDLMMPPADACAALEAQIKEAAKPDQDNYTGIILRYQGKAADGKEQKEQTENAGETAEMRGKDEEA